MLKMEYTHHFRIGTEPTVSMMDLQIAITTARAPIFVNARNHFQMVTFPIGWEIPIHGLCKLDQNICATQYGYISGP